MIKYSSDIKDINKDDLVGFFVGWAAPLTHEKHYELLKNSGKIVVAIDDETGRVVGFINALTDGVNAAFISLLEVLPGYQGQGIGSKLVTKMLDLLEDINCIDLMCDEDMQPFYAKFDMMISHGMVIRKYLKK